MNILAHNRRRHWTVFAGTVGCALALAGCPEPNLKITVKLPDGYSKDATMDAPNPDGGTAPRPLTVELAIYAPTGSEGVDCEKIAWGDVPTLALRSARVYNVQLLPDADGTATASASVNRAGRKFAVALGAFEFGEFGITLREAVLAGCIEIGEIAGDTAVTIETVRTTFISPVSIDRAALFLNADVPAAGVAKVVVSTALETGDYATSTALHLEFKGYDFVDGEAKEVDATTLVRLSVINARDTVSSQTVSEPATSFDAALTVDTPGHFTIVPRLRYQHGDDLPPIDGLAYRTLADSQNSEDLASAMAEAGSVAVGLVGARATFVTALFNPPPLIKFFTPRPTTAGELQFDRAQVSLVNTNGPPLGLPIALLGFSRIGAARSAVLAATPRLLMPQPMLAHLIGSAGNQVDIRQALDELPNPVDPFMPSAATIGPCEMAAPPILVHVVERLPAATTNHYWLYDPASDAISYLPDVLKEPAGDQDRPLLTDGLQQSLCDNEATPSASHRLLLVKPAGSFGLMPIFELSGAAQSIDQVPETPSTTFLPGLITGSALAWSNSGTSVLAPLVHNDQFEINVYLSETSGPACAGVNDCLALRYMTTVFTGKGLPRFAIAKADPAVGRLTQISRPDPNYSNDLAVLTVREILAGTPYPPRYSGELSIMRGDPRGRTASMPLPCSKPDQCKMFVADIDVTETAPQGDGIDELLLVTLEGTPPVWRIRIIRFAP